MAPVDQQVFDQEGADNHANPVMHVAGLPQFAHAGIDDWNTRSKPELPGPPMPPDLGAKGKWSKRIIEVFLQAKWGSGKADSKKILASPVR